MQVKSEVKVLVAWLCLIVCDLTDYSLPGSSVHEILQARILEYLFLHGILPTQELKLGFQAFSLLSETPGKPLPLSELGMVVHIQASTIK